MVLEVVVATRIGHGCINKIEESVPKLRREKD